MKRLTVLQTACALASLLMFAACTQDEVTDSTSHILPESKYPLMLTATQSEVVASPQTRVSDYDENGSHKSKWTKDDQIKVVVSGGNNDMETICTLNESGNITDYNPSVYWKTTQSSKINAWYSNIAGQSTMTKNIVSLANQSSGLAYVLKADEKSDVNYNSKDISLNFKHQLAKVRVKVEKGSYTGNLNVTAVSVKGYTSCTVNNGAVTAASGNSLGGISMKKNTYGNDTYWEANLVPGTNAMDKVITINADGKTTTCTLTSDITLAAGKVYTYTVKVNTAFSILDKNGSPVDASSINKDVTIRGTSDQPITITGTCNVTLDGVTFNIDNHDAAINVANGSPTLTVTGTNNINTTKGKSAILLTNENTDITLDGQSSGTLNISQSATAAIDKAIIGGKIDASVGNITIKNITLTIDRTNGDMLTAAVIGSGMAYESSSSCKAITITNTTLTVKNGGQIEGAIIGTGMAQAAGNNNVTASCGNITITLKSGQNQQQFLSGLNSTTDLSASKVGKGGTLKQGSGSATASCGTISWK
ncbi:fimbrillin family protein [Bacteroides sp. GD17]|jgi:hypothetical protein|uniref:fimbrillin family protein n=1 Tax=Bacteroides sp. GD17 TaxID=3139826 RepID=UPI0025DA1A87|nr:fimbrillin family protein [uncultured Bacteroides sp.]